MTDLHDAARTLRNLVEPISSGVYFAPEAIDGYAELGLDYFEGYFCSRGACLGKAPWSVIAAAFAAFKPEAVRAAVTSGWAKVEPEPVLAARERGATAQLERLIGGIASSADVARATAILDAATDGIDPSGRPIYAGLSVLARPTTPLGALWRAADMVREYRGDGHVAAWIPHVDATEITVLTELAWGIPSRSYVYTRGWSEAEVDAAFERLTARGLVADGALTDAGTTLRADIERTTDRAARGLLDRIGDDMAALFDLLDPWADAIVAGGGYPTSPKDLRVPG
jgi:hypothetical protein